MGQPFFIALFSKFNHLKADLQLNDYWLLATNLGVREKLGKHKG